VFSADKDRYPDWRGKFRIILRQIPEIARRAGERRPNGSAPTPPSGREAVAGRAPNGPEKVRQTIREFAREPPIRKNNVKRNT